MLPNLEKGKYDLCSCLLYQELRRRIPLIAVTATNHLGFEVKYRGIGCSAINANSIRFSGLLHPKPKGIPQFNHIFYKAVANWFRTRTSCTSDQRNNQKDLHPLWKGGKLIWTGSALPVPWMHSGETWTSDESVAKTVGDLMPLSSSHWGSTASLSGKLDVLRDIFPQVKLDTLSKVATSSFSLDATIDGLVNCSPEQSNKTLVQVLTEFPSKTGRRN